MSGKMSRKKGKRGENELVNILKNHGVPSERISQLEADGERKGDVTVAEIWKGSVKYGKQVPIWLYKARANGEQFLFSRRVSRSDRGYKWQITMDLDWFLKMFLGGCEDE